MNYHTKLKWLGNGEGTFPVKFILKNYPRLNSIVTFFFLFFLSSFSGWSHVIHKLIEFILREGDDGVI